MKKNVAFLNGIFSLSLVLCLAGTSMSFADDTYTEQTEGGVIYRIYSDHAVAADIDHNRPNVPETLNILASIGGQQVTEIMYDAFNYQHFTRENNKEPHKENVANIKHVFIPKSVKKIGSYSFFQALNLEDVTLEEGIELKNIDNGAFRECVSLTKFFIPKTVTNIGDHCFRDCSSLETVTFEEGCAITEVKPFAFQSCFMLSSINLPNTVTRLDNEAFKYDASLTALPLNDNITVIEQAVFSDCIGVTTPVKLPKNIKTIKWSAFQRVPMTSIVIPATLVNLGPWNFEGTGLQNVYFEYDNMPFPTVLPHSDFHWQEEGFFSMAFQHLNATGYCNKTVTNVPDVLKDNNGVVVLTLKLVDDVQALGISDVTAEGKGSNPSGIYTLSGVKINKGHKLQPGIYIVNGRKLLVRD